MGLPFFHLRLLEIGDGLTNKAQKKKKKISCMLNQFILGAVYNKGNRVFPKLRTKLFVSVSLVRGLVLKFDINKPLKKRLCNKFKLILFKFISSFSDYSHSMFRKTWQICAYACN